MEFTQQFKAARSVSTPLVAIRTFDAKSTIDSVRGILGKKLEETPLVLWDAVHGMRPLTKRGTAEIALMLTDPLTKDVSEVAASVPLSETLMFAERASKDLIIFISNAHLQWGGDNAAVVQGIWNLRDAYKAGGNMLVLLCAPGTTLPTELVNDVLILDEPLPTLQRLEEIVNETFKFAGIDLPSTETMTFATDALIGLPAFPAEQATAMCLDRKAKSLDLHELGERKRQIIGQTPGLSVWDGGEKIEDIGGISQVKKFMHQVMNGKKAPRTIIFIDEIEKAFAGTGTETSGVKTELTGSMLSWMQDTDMNGVIFIGLPGVSKSQLAKATGGSYNKTVVKFDLAAMQSGLVGSSNANLRSAQATVNAISNGDVLAIATCNSIGALPPELRRRFNLGIYFFDSPSKEERELIWDIYIKKYKLPKQERTFNEDGWTGAEIKECARKADMFSISLDEASESIVPVTLSSADLIYNLRESSSGKYLSASKPGVYHFSETRGHTEIALANQSGGRTYRE